MSQTKSGSLDLQTLGDSLSRLLAEQPAKRGRPKVRKPRILVGVTTYNRVDYIGKFLESFLATKSKDLHHTLIVADDGSTDGTIELVKSLSVDASTDVVLIQNRGVGIAGQTNAILYAAKHLQFDLGFEADDDISFKKPGWDVAYLNAVQRSGLGHLVFHDNSWKKGNRRRRRDELRSSTDARGAMGCLWTFTQDVLNRVGFFDEQNFPIRGHAHLDFTLRACRAGFNEADTLWDLAEAKSFVALAPREDYVQSFDWKSKTAKALFTPAERERRQAVLDDESRLFIEYNPVRFTEPQVWTNNPKLDLDFPDFGVHGEMSGRAPAPYGFVMSLGRTPERWLQTSKELKKAGIPHERVAGVDGYSESNRKAWRAYSAKGLVSEKEKQLGRKLLQTPGAMGYLLSARKVIQLARKRRLDSFILFDDDVCAHVNAAELLHNCLEQLPERWKLFYLGTRQSNWYDTQKLSHNLYKSGQLPMGSFAVAIHSSAYDQIEAEIDKLYSPFDVDVLRSVWQSDPNQVFIAWPPVFLPNVDESIIRESREIRSLAQGSNWNLADYPSLRRSNAAPETPAAQVPTVDVLCPVLNWRPEDLRRARISATEQYEDLGSFALLLPYESEPIGWTVENLCEADNRVSVQKPLQDVPLTDAANQVLAELDGEMVLVLPGPSILLPGALHQIRVELEQRKLDALMVRGRSSGERLPSLGFATSAALESLGTARTGALLIRRSALEKVGGLTAACVSNSTELLRRLNRASLDIGQSAAAPLVFTNLSSNWHMPLAEELTNSDFDSPIKESTHLEVNFVDVLRRADGRPLVDLISLPSH